MRDTLGETRNANCAPVIVGGAARIHTVRDNGGVVKIIGRKSPPLSSVVYSDAPTGLYSQVGKGKLNRPPAVVCDVYRCETSCCLIFNSDVFTTVHPPRKWLGQWWIGRIRGELRTASRRRRVPTAWLSRYSQNWFCPGTCVSTAAEGAR